MRKRPEITRSLSRTLLLLALLVVVPIRALADHDDERGRDDDRYVFATTRSLNHMDMHPVMKVILMPGAVILDVVLFPLAALADVAS